MIRQLLLELKALRLLYFVPAAVWFVLLPAIGSGVLEQYASDGEKAFRVLGESVQLFLPLFSAWWPLFIMKEYLNAPGNELLFAHRFGANTLLARTALLWVWAEAHFLALYLFFGRLFPDMPFLLELVSLQSVILLAAGYFLAVLSCNTFLPLMALTLYTIGCLFFRFPVSIFLDRYSLYPGAQSRLYLPLLLAAGMLAGGYALERRLGRNGKMKTFQ